MVESIYIAAYRPGVHWKVITCCLHRKPTTVFDVYFSSLSHLNIDQYYRCSLGFLGYMKPYFSKCI